MRLATTSLALVAALALGCGDDDPNGCPETGTGALDLTVTGLEGSARPRVALTRGSESRELTAAGRQEALSAGWWTLAPEPVAASGGLVRAAYDAPALEVCVRDGETVAATVGYALIPSSQKLWLSTSNGAAEVEAFSEADLGVTGSPGAAVLLGSNPSLPRASGLTFDRRGNLWVALGSGELRRYPARELGASGTKTPDVILKGSALNAGLPGPISIAFDASGNLWTTIGFSNKVLRFSPEQIASSGSPTPEVELTGLGDPAALAFDAAGNLWVGDTTPGASRVHKVAAASLSTSGTVTPVTSIDTRDTSPVVSFTGPAGLAFDGAGNLWVAYGSSGVVVRLTPEEQGGSGTVSLTPAVQIDAGGPKELVFDEAGNLWMAYASGQISRLGPAQLGTSGSPTPEVVITSADLGATYGVAVYPAPANLPLFHRLP